MAKKSKQLRAALEKIDSTKAYSVEAVSYTHLDVYKRQLLIYQAYFVSLLKLEGSSVGPTLSRILGDLVHLRVSSFAGGGLLGAILYLSLIHIWYEKEPSD